MPNIQNCLKNFLYFLEMKILNIRNLVTRRPNNDTFSVNKVEIDVFLTLVSTVLYPVG
jgi:hypothetical protein